jgi:hypothetical protein
MAYFIARDTQRRSGGGRPRKWHNLNQFINGKIRHYWECGAPLTSEKLQALVQQHIHLNCDDDAADTFVKGKQNTFHKFMSRMLKRNQWSI